MTTPAAMSFSGLIVTCGLIFVFWHAWHYDRWRCLVYTRQDWFRALMCHILILSVSCFTIYVWIDVHVLYSEYWIYYAALDEVIVSPWQLWSTQHQKQWRASLYCITVAWGFLQGVHLEEVLYWGYLIKSIRTPGGPRTTWLQSGFFKLWILLFVSAFALLIGAVRIETTNLDMMRAYLFCVGSSTSILLAAASVALCVVFPSFLKTVRQQGATHEVLERLHFFAEMNEIRTVCRVIYSVVFLIISTDGLTAATVINQNRFWSDALFLTGQLSLFLATCLSVVVLLPRNMTSESLPPSNETTFHPMVPYKRPAPDGHSARQYFELGDRLNLGHDVMAAGLLSPSRNEYGFPPDDIAKGGERGFEMSVTSPSDTAHAQNQSAYQQPTAVAPFAQAADRTRKARLSEFPSLPSVVSRFKSPFETAEPKVEGPTQVVVTTSQSIVEE